MARLTPVRCARLVAGLALGVGVARAWVGWLFFRHTSRLVFGRAPRLRALGTFLTVSRPLGVAWRMATARLRSPPELYVLGEVRCGTTTAAAMLRSGLAMQGPFTPWVHPLAEKKESFFLAGHFWGLVSPKLYSMVFPPSAWRWLYRVLTGRRLFVFEGCASYLSAPWAPKLVSSGRVVPSSPAAISAALGYTKAPRRSIATPSDVSTRLAAA